MCWRNSSSVISSRGLDISNPTYRDRSKKEVSIDVTVVCGLKNLILMHPESLISLYLYPRNPTMTMYPVGVMCLPSLRKATEATVMRAYDLGVDNPERPVSDEDVASLNATWKSFPIQELFKSLDISSWMSKSDVEEVLKEVLVVGPIMDA